MRAGSAAASGMRDLTHLNRRDGYASYRTGRGLKAADPIGVQDEEFG